MIMTSISRSSSNGFYSRRIIAFKKAMKEAYPNLTDNDIEIIIRADADDDIVSVTIKNIDVDPNVFDLLYRSFFIDQLPCIKEDKVTKEQIVFDIIKNLGSDPSLMAVATALAECAQIINS